METSPVSALSQFGLQVSLMVPAAEQEVSVMGHEGNSFTLHLFVSSVVSCAARCYNGAAKSDVSVL